MFSESMYTMRTVSLCVFVLFLFSFSVCQGQTRKSKPAPRKATVQRTTKPKAPVETVKATPDNPEGNVRGIISFLEYLLNTLGDPATPASDKAVIFTESYAKVFRDAKVQVEDDLDETRTVITNKDVPAYLKDVDFFFKEARFELLVNSIQREERDDHTIYFKATLTRHLNGTTSAGVPVNNTKPRFLEINYNPADQSLKIVSMYTNVYSEKDALLSWWKQLSYAWQDVFRRSFQVRQDSLDISEIRKVTSLKTLDLSGNTFIQDLSPLAQLTGLEVLTLSATPIADLSPLRNLAGLRELDLSSTKVTDLSAIRYAIKLEKLILHHTDIGDISVVGHMPKLRTLDASHSRVSTVSALSGLAELDQLNLGSTPVSDISALGASGGLTDLTLSRTGVTDLSSLAGLNKLKTINFDSTQVTDVDPLRNLESLETIHMSATGVLRLEPLTKLKKLTRIYCDGTPIRQPQADAFRSVNASVLVIFDTNDLTTWWNAQSPSWQKVIQKALKLQAPPSKEELAAMTKLDSFNVGGLDGITDLGPLSRFPKLRKLIASHTSISDLSPLQQSRQLEYLDVSATEISNLSPVAQHPGLKVLKVDRTRLAGIDRVMPGVERLYADGTLIDDWHAKEFLEKNPKCLLIYKTERLKVWWSSLPAGWKEIFLAQEGMKTPGHPGKRKEEVTPEELHGLVEARELRGRDEPVTDLAPLSEFIRLESLHLHGTALTEVTPPMNLLNLKSLHLTGCPLMETESLAQFRELEELDISNTPVEDIYPLWKLKKLKHFNCSGTQVKHLNALEKMEALEYFDCSNTRVSKLEPLDFLPLKTLKCFNTRLSGRSVERFKSAHPDCSIVFY